MNICFVQWELHYVTCYAQTASGVAFSSAKKMSHVLGTLSRPVTELLSGRDRGSCRSGSLLHISETCPGTHCQCL